MVLCCTLSLLFGDTENWVETEGGETERLRDADDTETQIDQVNQQENIKAGFVLG